MTYNKARSTLFLSQSRYISAFFSVRGSFKIGSVMQKPKSSIACKLPPLSSVEYKTKPETYMHQISRNPTFQFVSLKQKEKKKASEP